MLEWASGEDLSSGDAAWIPASFIYACPEPGLYRATNNGSAAGNVVREATLHALYELLERDAISRLTVDGRLQIKARCRVIDPATIEDPSLRRLADAIADAGDRLVLLSVPSIASPARCTQRRPRRSLRRASTRRRWRCTMADAG